MFWQFFMVSIVLKLYEGNVISNLMHETVSLEIKPLKSFN